jgi:WhiB family redox-sensing transcriptional regulator
VSKPEHSDSLVFEDEDFVLDISVVPGERYVTYQLYDLYPGWHRDALCVGERDELFFGASEPDIRPPYNLADIKRAKAMCGGCPVAAACLRSALQNREEYGVWAGTTRKQRRKMLAAIDSGITDVETLVRAYEEYLRV